MADGWIGITACGEDGWEVDGWVWNEKHVEQTLGEFLASEAGLPDDEAHQWQGRSQANGLTGGTQPTRRAKSVAGA